MFSCQRPANATVTGLLCLKLNELALHGAVTKLHVFADLGDAQALGFNHLYDLEFKVCVKYSS